MLEIVGITVLSIFNAKAAKLRRRRAGGAVAYTIFLWLFMSLSGLILGLAVTEGKAPVAALGLSMFLGLMGGATSWIIAHRGIQTAVDLPPVQTPGGFVAPPLPPVTAPPPPPPPGW